MRITLKRLEGPTVGVIPAGTVRTFEGPTALECAAEWLTVIGIGIEHKGYDKCRVVVLDDEGACEIRYDVTAGEAVTAGDIAGHVAWVRAECARLESGKV